MAVVSKVYCPACRKPGLRVLKPQLEYHLCVNAACRNVAIIPAAVSPLPGSAAALGPAMPVPSMVESSSWPPSAGHPE